MQRPLLQEKLSCPVAEGAPSFGSAAGGILLARSSHSPIEASPSVTLEQARRFEDLLRANTQDAHFAFETIFDESSFAGQQRSRKKFRMLKRIAPRLREILREGEKVRYLTRGKRYAERESFLAGVAVGLLNRRAVVVTNQRIILLQIGNRSKPKDFVEQIRYTAIADVSPTLFSNIRITFSDRIGRRCWSTRGIRF